MSNSSQAHLANNLPLTDALQNALEVTLDGQTMANNYQITYIDSEKNIQKNPPEHIKSDIEAIFVEINQQMSIYQDNSEISQFNQNRDLEPIKISADFAHVVREAIHIAHLTNNGLDITLAPIIDLWGFGASDDLQKGKGLNNVDQQALAEFQSYVGMDKIKLDYDDGEHYLHKTETKTSIDLCAIAKGFAVDKVARYLDKQGINNYLVNIGGEMRAKGVNGYQKTWRIGIETPDNSEEVFAVVQLHNRSLATSANYRNFYTNDKGEHLCHIIDYQTHQPTRSDILSLSVIADDCMSADGLATALLALGKDKALAFANEKNLPIYLITLTADGKFKPYSSSVFEQYFDHL